MCRLPFFAAACFLIVFLLPISTALHGRNTPRLPDALSGWRAESGAHAETLAALKKAIDHYEGKRYKEALTLLNSVKDAEKMPFGNYILLYRAKSCMELKQYADALEYFRLLEKYFPDSPQLREAVMGQCSALLELNSPVQARALLGKYGKYTGAEPLYYEAKALHLEGKKDEAVKIYLQIYAKYPSSSFSSPSYDSVLKLSPDAFTGARNYLIRLERAENRIREKDYSSARTLLNALGSVSAPDAKTAQRRALLRAEAEYNLNGTSSALTVLENFKTDDPVMHAKSLYLEGASRRRLKQESALIALRDRALKLFPKSSDTEELCYSAAAYFDVNYERHKSRDAYKVLVQAFPNGKYAETAQWKIALTYWFEGKYAEAAREFLAYIIANPGTATAGSGMYWLGRCYAKAGAAQEALYLYRRTRALTGDGYYGIRAAEAEEDLKSVQSRADGSVFDIDFSEIRALCDGIRLADVEAVAAPDAVGINILRRAEQLTAAGLEIQAIAELRWNIDQYPQNQRAFQYVMAKISAIRGNYYESISTLRRVFPDYNARAWDELPEEVWDLFYPTRYSDIVARHAKRVGLDTPLVMSLIRQESAFKATARSSADARGLMQLLPSTARETAPSAGVTRAQAGNLYDPEINIRLGTTYFAAMLKRHGRQEFALAAYNAGGSRVSRWVNEFVGDDIAGFVEQIPFTETRNYVKVVLGNVGHYRRIPTNR